MPQQIETSFTAFKFTNEELLEASILSPLLEMRLKTMMCEIAEQKLSQVFDVEKPLDKITQDAFLDGQIGILRTLLLASEESKIQLLAKVQEVRNF